MYLGGRAGARARGRVPTPCRTTGFLAQRLDSLDLALGKVLYGGCRRRPVQGCPDPAPVCAREVVDERVPRQDVGAARDSVIPRTARQCPRPRHDVILRCRKKGGNGGGGEGNGGSGGGRDVVRLARSLVGFAQRWLLCRIAEGVVGSGAGMWYLRN